MDFYDVIFIEHTYTDKLTAEKKAKELAAKYKSLTFNVISNPLGYVIRAAGKTTADTIEQIKKELEE